MSNKLHYHLQLHCVSSYYTDVHNPPYSDLLLYSQLLPILYPKTVLTQKLPGAQKLYTFEIQGALL